jgi:hypothetical protein
MHLVGVGVAGVDGSLTEEDVGGDGDGVLAGSRCGDYYWGMDGSVDGIARGLLTGFASIFTTC